MLLASGVIAALSITIVALRIPKRPELEKFRNARTIFAVAGFLLATLNFLCFIVGYTHPYDKMAILATAPYEALLMTCTVLVFINPERVTKTCVVREFLFITALVSIMYLTHWKFPDIFPYVYVTFGIAFLVQIISYTTIFVKSYKRVVKLTSEYYAEDYAPRIIWVLWMFVFVLISALACFICLFDRKLGILRARPDIPLHLQSVRRAHDNLRHRQLLHHKCPALAVSDSSRGQW